MPEQYLRSMSAWRFSFTHWLRLKTRWLAPWVCEAPEPETWLFVVGCYNSGTTLLHKMLASHPDIGSMPNEGQFFTDQLPRGADFGIPRLWALRPELFRWTESDVLANPDRIKKQWAWFMNDTRRSVLMDKTIANSARTRWLQSNFKGSKFVLLFRDPFAVSEGIKRKEGHSVSDAATQWAESNRILLDDARFLEWVIEVRYEDLVQQPNETLRRITEFLGLPPLESRVVSGEFRIHKQQSEIRNMNLEAKARLSKEESYEITSRCSAVMEKLGYY
jgi:hypothetical protein